MPFERISAESQVSDAISQFAQTLCSQLEEVPQAAVDLINKHFWDLL